MDTSEHLDGAVRAIRERFGADAPPGIAIAAVDGDRTVAAIDGVRRRAGTGVPEDLPLTPETAFDLASVTKAVTTTTSLARLAAAGELTVDDPVARYVPTAPIADGTTLRHLLRHRAGLWEWWPLYAGPGMPFEILDELPLRYAPDTVRAYSDLGFVLLGRVVSAGAGEPLDEAVAHLVTSPLALDATRFAHPVDGADVAANAPDGDAIERRMLATGQPYPVRMDPDTIDGWRTGTIVAEVSDGNAFHAFGGISGHAGLFSTVPDLLRFTAAMAGDGFLPAEVRDDFFAAGPDPEQALGYRRDTVRIGDRTAEVLWHPGYTGTGVGWIPDERRGVVLATNRLHAHPTVGDVEPVPTMDLWRTALDAAGKWFAENGNRD